MEAPNFGYDAASLSVTFLQPPLLCIFFFAPVSHLLSCRAAWGDAEVGVTKGAPAVEVSTVALALGGPRKTMVLWDSRWLLMRRAPRVLRMLVHCVRMILRSALGRRLFARRWLTSPPPSSLAELFQGMPADRMLRSIEANAMRVSSNALVPLCFCASRYFAL